mgnify:CR=1 FL=1
MDDPLVYLLVMGAGIFIVYFFVFDGDSSWLDR